MCGPPISQSAWIVSRRMSRSRYSGGILAKSLGATLSLNCDMTPPLVGKYYPGSAARTSFVRRSERTFSAVMGSDMTRTPTAASIALAIDRHFDRVRVSAVEVLVLFALAGDDQRRGGPRGLVQRLADLGQTRLQLARAVERGVARDGCDAASADAGIDVRVPGVALPHAHAGRFDAELARDDALDHGVRTAALIRHAGEHVDGTVGRERQRERCLAAADVPRRERQSAAVVPGGHAARGGRRPKRREHARRLRVVPDRAFDVGLAGADG